MKILAFTDLHGEIRLVKKLARKAKKADIALCAGDFTVFESGTKQMLSAMNRIGKKVMLIHGNHESERRVEKECKRLRNVIYIHKKAAAVEFNGKKYTFIGYGGGGFSLTDPGFERFASRHAKKENLILITHAPPHKTRLDKLWEHRGCRSIAKFIRKAKPLLAVSGHFHENFGKKDRIGKTLLVNPGPKGMIIEV